MRGLYCSDKVSSWDRHAVHQSTQAYGTAKHVRHLRGEVQGSGAEGEKSEACVHMPVRQRSLRPADPSKVCTTCELVVEAAIPTGSSCEPLPMKVPGSPAHFGQCLKRRSGAPQDRQHTTTRLRRAEGGMIFERIKVRSWVVLYNPPHPSHFLVTFRSRSPTHFLHNCHQTSKNLQRSDETGVAFPSPSCPSSPLLTSQATTAPQRTSFTIAIRPPSTASAVMKQG